MEDRTFQTRELVNSGREADYTVWFRVGEDGSKVTIEMSLGGLLQLQGLVNRAVEGLRDAVPDEMNAHPSVSIAATAVL